MSQTSLRAAIAHADLDMLLSDRDKISDQPKAAWGSSEAAKNFEEIVIGLSL